MPFVIQLLTSKKTKEISDFKYDKLAIFGIGTDKDEHHWNSVIRNAMMIGLLDKDIEQYGTLKLNEKSMAFLEKPTKVEVALNHNYEDDGTEVDLDEAQGARSVVDLSLIHI